MAKTVKGLLRLDVKDNNGRLKMLLATADLDEKKDSASMVDLRANGNVIKQWKVTKSQVKKSGTRLDIEAEPARGSARSEPEEGILADLVGDLTVTVNFSGVPLPISQTCYGDP